MSLVNHEPAVAQLCTVDARPDCQVLGSCLSCVGPLGSIYVSIVC